MQFSCDWLRQYVEPGVGAEEVASRLTAAGLAVEGQERRGDDVIFDVDVTTNRPDCMCHFGLAREIAALFARPLQVPDCEVPEVGKRASEVARVEIEDETGCPRYVARVVEGVQVGASPDWLVERLEAIGQRPINNVVDVTNFVLWELGQPIHAFDLDRLSEASVVVRRARQDEMLKTLDGENRKLDREVLVIADAERPVALAGIMGGLDTEVTSSTVDVLIESAHFDPARVRMGARKLGLHTDANHRFERGADPEICRIAADRVAKLVAEIAGGEVLADAVDVRVPEMDWVLMGRLELERIERFSGLRLEGEQIERWLEGIGFVLESESKGRWRVRVPSWRYYDLRPDPTRPGGQPQGEVFEADLFEEVLRLHGLEDIPSTLPDVGGPDEGSSAGHWQRESMRRHLAACGYLEAVTFAFHDRESEARFPALVRDGEPLALANPLSELYTIMRRSLFPGLVAAAEFNQRRGAERVRFFEIGHLFPGGESAEVEAVALVAGGGSQLPWSRQSDYDLFDLKGAVQSLGEHFGLALRFEAAEVAGCVKGTASEILVGTGAGTKIGFLGRIEHEQSPYPLYGAELETSSFGLGEPSQIRLPSRFPSVEVDLTLTHGANIPWRDLDRDIEAMAVSDLVKFGLKDRYQGQGVPAGAVNTTIYFLYNAADRSLTQEEVNQRHEAVRQRLQSRFGWKGST